MHYNSDNSYFFVSRQKVFKFIANIKNIYIITQFFLGNLSKTFDHIESEEVSFKGNVHDFNATDKFETWKIHKRLITKNDIWNNI